MPGQAVGAILSFSCSRACLAAPTPHVAFSSGLRAALVHARCSRVYLTGGASADLLEPPHGGGPSAHSPPPPAAAGRSHRCGGAARAVDWTLRWGAARRGGARQGGWTGSRGHQTTRATSMGGACGRRVGHTLAVKAPAHPRKVAGAPGRPRQVVSTLSKAAASRACQQGWGSRTLCWHVHGTTRPLFQSSPSPPATTVAVARVAPRRGRLAPRQAVQGPSSG